MMGRGGRKRNGGLKVDRLEGRSLLSGDILGNGGTIVASQFQPYGNGVVGSEWLDVGVRGPVSVRLTTPYRSGDTTATPGGLPPASTGLVALSQFNAGGFFKVGTQLRGLRVGGGLNVSDYDESIGHPADGSPTAAPGLNPVEPAYPTNVGDILSSQFNDFGFGPIGLQWSGVTTGGGLSITNQTLVRNPAATTAPGVGVGDLTPVTTVANAGLIQNSQFNDGGFGKVGLQWDGVRVRGSVSVASETYAVEPGAEYPDPPTPAPRPLRPGRTYGDPTNTGTIRNSQFNDGGFGDLGMQWANVSVGGRVATSTNGLSIQPQTDGLGPITVTNKIFGRGLLAATSPETATATPATATPATSTVGVGVVATSDPTRNEATTSGQVLGSQFSDGGFGDVGMQWDGVAVAGDVAVTHNALSIQPVNVGQGLITVQNVWFPTIAAGAGGGSGGPLNILPPTPELVTGSTGAPLPTLPTPTRPGTQPFLRSDATNSGTILRSQFSDGGFGDVGMQWKRVKVGAVAVVHNSLSVHPEGTLLAGVNVANVAYGNPTPPSPRAARLLARNSTVAGGTILPSQYATTPPTNDVVRPGDRSHRVLKGVQYPLQLTAPLSLQWYAVRTTRGLVLVHNVIQVKLGDPTATAPITLSNIRMPGRKSVPITVETSAETPHPVTPDLATTTPAPAPTIIDSATNSGLLVDSQMSDGGFGDVGLQWRDVKIHGKVTVVHNTLSVDVSGSLTGPINVANVAFDSGALDGMIGRPIPLRIVTPPNHYSKLPAHRNYQTAPLPLDPTVVDNATNGGILLGGQFAAGGMNHIMLQWAKVGVPGSVTILDNVLSVSITGHGTAPVTIANVSYS